MRRWQLVLFPILIILIFFSTVSAAQNWAGIIDPTRAANWQRANVGVSGGIPSGSWTQCGATIAAYGSAGSPASPATINNAILACGQNQYVQLGSGTFFLNGGINIGSSGHNVNHVALRGTGPAQTTLAFTAGVSCVSGQENICMMNSTAMWIGSANVLPPCGGGNSTNCATWTGGYAQGSTSITLSNVGSSGILNGDVIILDQGNDTSETGGYIICDTLNPTVCHQSAENGSGNGRGSGGLEYSQEQYVTGTGGCSSSCKGTGPFTLTISPGLYANNWRASQAPGAWWVSPMATMIGVENLTIDNSNSSSRGNFAFYNCSQCWVKNIRSISGNRNHIWYFQSARGEIRDSYFFGTKNGSNQSYGIELGEPGGSDVLIENNVFQQIASPIVGG